MRIAIGLPFLLCCASVLGACAAGGDRGRLASQAVAPAALESSSSAALEPTTADAGPVSDIPVQGTTPAAATARADDPKRIDTSRGGATPEQLTGLGRAKLDALLGTPRLRRIEGPAEVRQYAAGNCVLDTYLYPDEEAGGAHLVIYYEARSRSGDAIAVGPCLAALVSESEALRSGASAESR